MILSAAVVFGAGHGSLQGQWAHCCARTGHFVQVHRYRGCDGPNLRRASTLLIELPSWVGQVNKRVDFATGPALEGDKNGSGRQLSDGIDVPGIVFEYCIR
jgi:hypothetical protein